MEHDIPADLKLGLQPVLDQIRDISGKIKEFDKIIAEVSQKRYPATNIVQQVGGIGPVSARAYVVTIGDPSRF